MLSRETLPGAVAMALPEEVGIEDALTTPKSFLWQHFGISSWNHKCKRVTDKTRQR